MQVEDVDYQIMINLNFKELIAFCEANKYTTKICTYKQFWINKIYYDKLIVPNQALFAHVNGIKCYHACHEITKYLKKKKTIKGKNKKYSKKYNDIVVINAKNVSKLILLYGNIDISFDDLSDIIHVNEWENFTITFKTDTVVDKFSLDKQSFINFLFEGISTDSITYKIA